MENTTLFTPLEVSHPDSSVANATYDIFQTALWKRLKILPIVIGSISFLLGVIGNGLVIFITGFSMKKTVNTVWFLNLAIADFTFTFFLPLSIALVALDFHWPFGGAMCKINSTVTNVNLYASVYLLTTISIDRCISVFAPVWAKNYRNPRCASFVAFGVWILALVLSLPVFHFRKTKKSMRNEDVIYCYYNYSHDAQQARGIHRDMVVSRFIFAFVIPFLVIIICYGAIVLRLRRNRLARSSKPFKVITSVIVAFFICWFPYHVFCFLGVQAYKDLTLHPVHSIGMPLTLSLAFFNSCLNPILYVFMGRDFKEMLKHSISSVLESTFTEEERQSMKRIRAKSSEDRDPQD